MAMVRRLAAQGTETAPGERRRKRAEKRTPFCAPDTRPLGRMMMKAMMEEQRMPLHSLVKRWVLCVLAAFAICLPHMACAQVFLSQQPPEDWDMEHTRNGRFLM